MAAIIIVGTQSEENNCPEIMIHQWILEAIDAQKTITKR